MAGISIPGSGMSMDFTEFWAKRRAEHAAEHRVPGEMLHVAAKLAEMTQALWVMMQQAYGLTDEELLQRIREIDICDGQLDGVARLPVRVCPHCGQKMAARNTRCLYCDAELGAASPFAELGG